MSIRRAWPPALSTHRGVLLGVLLLAACGLPETEASCARLDAEACETAEACRTLDGRDLVDRGDDPPCIDFAEPSTPLGCTLAGGGCADVETLAAPPGDPADCHWFPSSCVPAGWGSCTWDFVRECPAGG